MPAARAQSPLLTISCYYPTMIGFWQQAITLGRFLVFDAEKGTGCVPFLRQLAARKAKEREGSTLETIEAAATLELAAGCKALDGGRHTVGSVTVLVVCCSTPSMSNDMVHVITTALSPVSTARAVVLSDSTDTIPGHEVIVVPPGTKLSKIRRLVDLVEADLICICDPDIRVDAETCQLVFGRAAEESCRGNEVVAFGIIEGHDTGSLLSRVVALDKWLSHRVIRRVLWGLGIGITLPGQFLVVSAELLRRLDPGVDSYLDDLYLGWIARSQGVKVHRLSVVVGEEDTRATWGGLLAQRLRWMKGLAHLFGHLAGHPSAIFLLTVHFLAYHGLPIVLLLALVALSIVSPVLAVATLSTGTIVLAHCSGRSYRTTATFLVVFPIVHCLATLLWWVPASRSYLARR